MIRSIELLAPARDLATGRVAVDAGADAVYIGGPGFGARRAAGNSLDDVAELVRYARPFGVRVYATLNTLLFDDELDEAYQVSRGLLGMQNKSAVGAQTDAGVDALIVQDMAFLRMGFSGVEFHASTQTSNIDPGDVDFLGRAGFRRVILERALSLDEIRTIRAATPQEVELEVFIHGAICVGYSGRCFMSHAMEGARSGNRGDCSQPCRLAWDLTDDGGNTLMKGRHMLSVRDLDLSARIGELLDAGVSSFKIEGRLKDAGYVRNIVSHYRRLIDRELERRPGLRRASVGISTPDFAPDPAKSFTRGGGNGHGGLSSHGGTEYFLDGGRRGIASFDTPKSMGEIVGHIVRTGCERTGNRFFEIEHPKQQLAAGDGICWLAGGELKGTNINRVEGARVYPDKCEGITSGTEIYRNHDHAFVRALERSRMKRRIGVSAKVQANGERIVITFTDETGLSVSVRRKGPFEAARDARAMTETLRRELVRSGDTIFEVGEVQIPPEIPFIPASTLTRMRREGLERLQEARAELPPERHPVVEDMSARPPRTHLTAAENVTNCLAEQFWRDHGVTEIEPALELQEPQPGEAVMRTRYCIRREIGECLREGSRLKGDMFLERGATRWRLDFDCEKCIMEATATADFTGSSSRMRGNEVKCPELNRKP